jgi:ribosomal protein S18 acetylase RimI-like enzyme
VIDRDYVIRPVRPHDVPAVVAMVHELAEFERAPQHCHLTTEQLDAALFGGADQRGTAAGGGSGAPALFGHVAVKVDHQTAPGSTDGDTVVGFALWFLNFSTWEGVHGIFLEDLYVRPETRGTGTGRALLAALAAIAVERGYRRVDWQVLNWNPAREFYAGLGATALADWVPYRVEGRSLHALADEAADPVQTV